MLIFWPVTPLRNDIDYGAPCIQISYILHDLGIASFNLNGMITYRTFGIGVHSDEFCMKIECMCSALSMYLDVYIQSIITADAFR